MNHVFSGMAALRWRIEDLTGGKPEVVEGNGVTPNFFEVFQLTTAMACDGLYSTAVLSSGGVVSHTETAALPTLGRTNNVDGIWPDNLVSVRWVSLSELFGIKFSVLFDILSGWKPLSTHDKSRFSRKKQDTAPYTVTGSFGPDACRQRRATK